MNPEEKILLDRTLKLSEENNKILRSLQRKMRWTILWGIIKLVIIVTPFIIGYLYLEPYLGSISGTLQDAQQVIEKIK